MVLKGGFLMATNKRVFTLRLEEPTFNEIGKLASKEHRSLTNFIEFVLLKYLNEQKESKKDTK